MASLSQLTCSLQLTVYMEEMTIFTCIISLLVHEHVSSLHSSSSLACMVINWPVFIYFIINWMKNDQCSLFPAHQAHDAFEGVRPRPTKPLGFPFLKEWHIISCVCEVQKAVFGDDSRANTAEFVHVCFVQSSSEESSWTVLGETCSKALRSLAYMHQLSSEPSLIVMQTQLSKFSKVHTIHV